MLVGDRSQADPSLASFYLVCGSRTGGASYIGGRANRTLTHAGWGVAVLGNPIEAAPEQFRSAGDQMSALTSGRSASGL